VLFVDNGLGGFHRRLVELNEQQHVITMIFAA
jgi:hypothetical protein